MQHLHLSSVQLAKTGCKPEDLNSKAAKIQGLNDYTCFLYEPSCCAIHQWYVLTPS
jgi:hypothetical protein